MDAFSYLSVLLSIILGLGLTQLLTAAGRLIRHRERLAITGHLSEAANLVFLD